MATDKIILVLGATGQQGGAVSEHLLRRGWRVRAFSRNASGEAASALARAGAEIAEGDMEDRVSLDAAMQGAFGVFSVQPPEWNPSDAATEREIRLGKHVADAAKAAYVRHFVYSSVSGADRQSRFRYLAKWELEQYLKKLDMPTTVLRPSGFMESYATPQFGIQSGVLAEPTNPNVPMKLIAVDDIGVFAALAFEQPETFIGKTLEIAGDAITPPDLASAISRALQKPISYVHVPMEEIRRHNGVVADLYDWLNQEGYEVDFPALRTLHPGLMTVEEWLRKKGKGLFADLLNPN